MTFRIVTHRRWLAEEFAAVGGVLDHGFDLDPSTAHHDTWWASGAWVAGAAASGVRLPLLSAGPRWLENLPHDLTHRRVFVGTADDCRRQARSWNVDAVWCKLPEAKSDRMSADLVAVDAIPTPDILPGLVADTLLQISEPLAGLWAEARFFCSPDNVSSGAPYLVHGLGHDHPAFRPDDLLDVLSSLRETAERAYLHGGGPPGMAIDVSLCAQGPVVIEANAAWSSHPYGTDPAEVRAAIEAAHDRTGDGEPWLFDVTGVPRPWPRVTIKVLCNAPVRVEPNATRAARVYTPEDAEGWVR